MRRILLASENVNSSNAWHWLNDHHLTTLNGKQVVTRDSDGWVFQMMPDGNTKYDNVNNPGDWEVANESNGQLVWATGYSRLFVDRP